MLGGAGFELLGQHADREGVELDAIEQRDQLLAPRGRDTGHRRQLVQFAKPAEGIVGVGRRAQTLEGDLSMFPRPFDAVVGMAEFRLATGQQDSRVARTGPRDCRRQQIVQRICRDRFQIVQDDERRYVVILECLGGCLRIDQRPVEYGADGADGHCDCVVALCF